MPPAVGEEERKVECGTHGAGRRAAFVCGHILSGDGLGFRWARGPEDPDDPCPDAWCDRCDAVLDEEDGWTDRATEHAGIRLVCDRCYEIVRARNWREDGPAFERLLERSIAYLEDAQRLVRETYDLGSYDRYDWNQGAGTLVFSRGGLPCVVADIQFVGSVSRRSGTWLWSWANPSVDESMKARMREVREYGEEQGFVKLAGAHWDATEEDGWEMTSVAAALLGAKGAYRSPDGGSFTFLILTDVRWAQ